MTLKQAAVDLADGGFWIFPCKAGTKIPAIKGYMTAKWTVDQVEQWWSDHPDDNIAMVPALNDLVVVDVDLYKAECNWDRGEDLGTMTSRSARGGMHYFFDAEAGERYPGKFGGYEAVDVKHKGLVVLPPSRFEDGAYAWVDQAGTAPAPEWLPTKRAASVSPLDQLALLERGLDDRVLRAVEAAANRVEDREDWVKVGLGLHFEYAGTAFEERARQAWIEWCLRWQAGVPVGELEAAAIKLWDSAAPPEQAVAAGNYCSGGTVLHLVGEPRREPPVIRAEGPFLEIDGDDLLRRDLADIDYLIEDVLIAGGLHSWAGPSGVGKTRWVSLLIACLMTGRTDVMGLPQATRPVRTMYFANEERAEDVERRIKAAMHVNGLTGGVKPLICGKDVGTLRLVVSERGQAVKDEQMVEWIADQIRRAEVELVIFDPFNTLGGEEENSAAAVSEVMEALRDISALSGAAVAFIHHTPKDRSEAPDALRGDSNAWRGSGAIYSALDMGFTLFPLLPAAASSGKDAKVKRRALARLQQAGRCGKYVVQDTGKVREGESLGPVAYEFVGHAVRAGGKPIGALRAVAVDMAEKELELALEGDVELASQTLVAEWGGALIEALGVGEHATSLAEIDRVMLDASAGGWDGQDKPVTTRGRGKKLLDLFASPRVTAGHVVQVEHRAGADRRKKLAVSIAETRR